MLEREISQKRGICFWLTGLSGSGKTTISRLVEKELLNINFPVSLIDGDLIRNGMNKDLGFTISDRTKNIKRAAETIQELNNCGTTVIASFISPTKEIRDLAKNIIGINSFYEVYVQCPLEICENRDTKGLYKKARQGEIQNFTGISSVYEEPGNPDITLDTDLYSQEESSIEMFNFVKLKIGYTL